MTDDTTGFNNTAVGFEALFSNATGYDNSAFGLQALIYNSGNVGLAQNPDFTALFHRKKRGAIPFVEACEFRFPVRKRDAVVLPEKILDVFCSAIASANHQYVFIRDRLRRHIEEQAVFQ